MNPYTIYITPEAFVEIKNLPGHVRQRIKRAVDELADQPRPADSKALALSDELDYAVWRLRIDKWRIIYAITEDTKTIDVLAIRKRPPYDYRDLDGLLAKLL